MPIESRIRPGSVPAIHLRQHIDEECLRRLPRTREWQEPERVWREAGLPVHREVDREVRAEGVPRAKLHQLRLRIVDVPPEYVGGVRKGQVTIRVPEQFIERGELDLLPIGGPDAGVR